MLTPPEPEPDPWDPLYNEDAYPIDDHFAANFARNLGRFGDGLWGMGMVAGSVARNTQAGFFHLMAGDVRRASIPLWRLENMSLHTMTRLGFVRPVDVGQGVMASAWIGWQCDPETCMVGPSAVRTCDHIKYDSLLTDLVCVSMDRLNAMSFDTLNELCTELHLIPGHLPKALTHPFTGAPHRVLDHLWNMSSFTMTPLGNAYAKMQEHARSHRNEFHEDAEHTKIEETANALASAYVKEAEWLLRRAIYFGFVNFIAADVPVTSFTFPEGVDRMGDHTGAYHAFRGCAKLVFPASFKMYSITRYLPAAKHVKVLWDPANRRSQRFSRIRPDVFFGCEGLMLELECADAITPAETAHRVAHNFVTPEDLDTLVPFSQYVFNHTTPLGHVKKMVILPQLDRDDGVSSMIPFAFLCRLIVGTIIAREDQVVRIRHVAMADAASMQVMEGEHGETVAQQMHHRQDEIQRTRPDTYVHLKLPGPLRAQLAEQYGRVMESETQGGLRSALSGDMEHILTVIQATVVELYIAENGIMPFIDLHRTRARTNTAHGSYPPVGQGPHLHNPLEMEPPGGIELRTVYAQADAPHIAHLQLARTIFLPGERLPYDQYQHRLRENAAGNDGQNIQDVVQVGRTPFQPDIKSWIGMGGFKRWQGQFDR